MSEMGEYWAEKRLQDQIKKLKQLKWNTDVVLGYAVEYGYDIKQYTEHHICLFNNKRNMWLDYWPSTGKAKWKNQTTKTFHIPDIEAYLMKHFKP